MPSVGEIVPIALKKKTATVGEGQR